MHFQFSRSVLWWIALPQRFHFQLSRPSKALHQERTLPDQPNQLSDLILPGANSIPPSSCFVNPHLLQKPPHTGRKASLARVHYSGRHSSRQKFFSLVWLSRPISVHLRSQLEEIGVYLKILIHLPLAPHLLRLRPSIDERRSFYAQIVFIRHLRPCLFPNFECSFSILLQIQLYIGI